MDFFDSSCGKREEEASSSSSYLKRPNNTELMLMNSSLIEREHMFEKVVTPSDVGKLNRLVIPKQHAEKYFPLDSSGNDKGGLLLNFEDSNGKPWRFRYSYWNSSQSYVMTKGWSRFVKEKKLDAGDTISFQRGAGEFSKHRLFIDWHHRPNYDHFSDARIFHLHPPTYYNHCTYMYGIGNSSASPYHRTSTSFNNNITINNIMMMRSAAPALQGVVQEPRVFNSVPVVQGKVEAKRLRLFGVNMDYPMDIPASIPTTSSEESSEKGKSFDLDI